jgi:drug/metabolite transporter (DMT)-like permease
LTARQAGLLAALSAIWGGSYLLIKWGLEDFSPGFVVWARSALGMLVLLVVMGAANRTVVFRDVRARPSRAFQLGLLAVALPFCLISFGELEVPSGLTAVLLAPASIFVAMLAPRFDPSETPTRMGAIGMGIGLAGVALLVGVETVSSLWEFLGAMAIVGAALSYSLGGFVVKGSYGGMPSIAASAISIGVAALLVTPLALAGLPDHAPGVRAVLSLVVLGVIGTALAFVIFYKLIAEVGAARASLISYLAPGVALFYGAAFGGEAITVAAVAGLALILGGVALASTR